MLGVDLRTHNYCKAPTSVLTQSFAALKKIMRNRVQAITGIHSLLACDHSSVHRPCPRLHSDQDAIPTCTGGDLISSIFTADRSLNLNYARSRGAIFKHKSTTKFSLQGRNPRQMQKPQILCQVVRFVSNLILQLLCTLFQVMLLHLLIIAHQLGS